MTVMQTIASGMARKLTEETERVIREAIDDYLGRDDWTLDEVKDRGQWVTRQGQPEEVLYFDGNPILELHLVETKIVDNRAVTTRKYRRLY